MNHHDTDYTTGIPNAVGDRYYAQDLFRDNWYIINEVGKLATGIYKDFPVLLDQITITEGSSKHEIDIEAVAGYCNHQITVPDSFASIPPTTKNEDVIVKVDAPAQTDLDIQATATLDGASTNYVKLRYTETNGNSRNRAKKAGSYNYEKIPSYEYVVNTTSPTDYDLPIATLVGDDSTFLTITPYVKTALKNQSYDLEVSTQDEFNSIIIRVSANRYKIHDDIKSLHLKNLTGGYLMYGATSPLTSGDTWGYLETNNCSILIAEADGYLHFGNTQGYLKTTTDHAYQRKVGVVGTGTVASAIVQSFLLDAEDVTYDDCYTENRLSNTDFSGFMGSGTALHNKTAKYSGCRVTSLTSSGAVNGFNLCFNVNDPYIYDLESTASTCFGTKDCENVNNIIIEKIDASSTCVGMQATDNITNFTISDLDGSGSVVGINVSNRISCGKIHDLDSSGGAVIGITDCYNLSTIALEDFQSVGANNCHGVLTCHRVSNITIDQLDGASGTVTGVNTCEEVSSILINDLDSASGNVTGILNCTGLDGDSCTITNLTAGGTATNHSGNDFVWTKEIDIGDWDMDANGSKSVAHGLTFTDVRLIHALIRNDSGTTSRTLFGSSQTGTIGGYAQVDSTNVNMYRTSAVNNGIFDNTSFDSTSYNRGWIIIKYTD